MPTSARAEAPGGFVRRALVRALRQYHVQVAGEQARFNAHVAGGVTALGERVDAVEARRSRAGSPHRESPVPPDSPAPRGAPPR